MGSRNSDEVAKDLERRGLKFATTKVWGLEEREVGWNVAVQIS